MWPPKILYYRTHILDFDVIGSYLLYQNSYASMRSINNNSCQCQDTVNEMWILLGPLFEGQASYVLFSKNI